MRNGKMKTKEAMKVLASKTDNSHNRFTCIYIVNHKKRDILFLTITLANLNRFL